MGNRLLNRNSFITGASRGIGLAIADRFADEGANVLLCARNKGPLEEAAKELRKYERRVRTWSADVTDQPAMIKMIKQALDEFGHIDILVNNAGAHTPSRFIDYTSEEFDRIIKVNLYGAFYVTQAVLLSMMERKEGKIINIASTAGKWGSINQCAYNASKHGLIGMTRCLGLEMAPYNINVNAICPALVETEMVVASTKVRAEMQNTSPEELLKKRLTRMPLQRIINPQEVARLAVYLASDECVNMTCQSISLCGGYIMV